MHECIKQVIGVNIALDMVAEGAVTCSGLARLASETWKRAPVETGPNKVLHVAVVSWCCNDNATWNQLPAKQGGRYRCKPSSAEMKAAAVDLHAVLEQYDAGIIVGPASADTWGMDRSWETGAAELLSLFKPDHFHVWN